MITREQHLKLREKYNPDGSNRRRAQLRMVEMLKFMDDFCQKNNILYWIDCGTLLGAIRHGGFIPWDDDTDVCMMRSDYKKFVKLFDDKQIGDYVLQTPKTDHGYFRFWNVIRDIKSEYVHSNDMPCEQMLKYRGLQIDIFPMLERYSRVSMNISKKLAWRINHYYASEANSRHHFLTKLYFNMADKIVFPLFRLLFRKKQDVILFDYGFYGKNRYRKDIFPLKRIEFEGVTLNAPNNSLAYCKAIYGEDCLEMPKSEYIYDHHTTVIFK